ncbi:hypothetical protein HHL17_11780 [Chitinophaga sp. G-6-1-13]|uniref:Uncharacterized protein n=1 Tax=Chitinophaga fulva TaxID=2728842 RepID=A0A848GGV6_9BACT|nr:hypothetical protein [Chitinophaga fulva]NML37875.1 hypothetical protein [Chitinophaga fulva]
MKKYVFIMVILFAGIVSILLMRRKSAATEESKPAFTEKDVNQTFPITISSDVPHDVAGQATPQNLCTFAWDEFFALNWKSDYEQSGTRGTADTKWRYETDKNPYPPLFVWETYKHRTELRPATNVMNKFDTVPYYTYYNWTQPAKGADTTVFNNLDENNEIGSCIVFGQSVTNDKQYQVLYQAKVNRDEYNYIRTHFGTKEKLYQGNINNKDSIEADSAYFKGSTSTCESDTFSAQGKGIGRVICLPCGSNQRSTEGAIEVKTAWRRLKPNEDSTRYVMRTVLTYENVNGVFRAVNERYALIGIHIIHKTTTFPNFVFATFEQVDVQNSLAGRGHITDMGYIRLDSNGNPTGPFVKNYPRYHPIPQVVQNSTTAAHSLILQRNPKSIWQYYRLVGVQAATTNDSTSFSYFLANYVIESDDTLAKFRGSSIDNPLDNKVNVIYGGKGYVMGGCQGCHGASQVRLGTDCSFLLDTVDKPVHHPDTGFTSSKLQRYLNAFRHVREERK